MNRATSDRRLLRLADFLKTVPRWRFDYDRWVGPDWKGSQNLSCGTTACALGWAATMPEFRRLGLRLAVRNGGPGYVQLDSYDGEQAGAALFGLSYEEACYLFAPNVSPPSAFFWQLPSSPRSSATPIQVANHIRRFVRRRNRSQGVA